MTTIPTTLRSGTPRSSTRPFRLRPDRVRVGKGKTLAALLLASVFVRCAPAQTTAPTNVPVILADFNHDGIPDALVPSPTTPTATVVLGSIPFGTFSSGAKVVNFPSACTAAFTNNLSTAMLLTGDFNGDGLQDIFYLCAGTSAGVLLGNGDGTFATAIPVATPTSIYSAVTGDFNHDGKLDIALVGTAGTSQTAEILFYSGTGDGTFATAVVSTFGSTASFSSTQRPNYVSAFDINADGFPDIVVNSVFSETSQAISVFGNNKDGTFGTQSQATRIPNTTALLGLQPTVKTFGIQAGNIFGSGYPDLVIPNYGGTLGYHILKNTSTATTYSFATDVLTASTGFSGLQLGNFTGTAFSDLAIANGTSISILANDGTGNFTTSYASLVVAATAGQFTAADANGDGYTDVYTASVLNGSISLGVNLVSGTATATSQPFSLPIGSTALSAVWPGNINYSGATATGSQSVVGTATVTSLTSSLNPSVAGNSVTFTAAVGSLSNSGPLPSGTVTFLDGTTILGTAALQGGDTSSSASFTTSSLSVATHSIMATYAGNSVFAASSSAVVLQVVTQPPAVAPTLTWAPGPITVGTPLSSIQLNAVATNATGATVPGAYVYTPAAGTIFPLPGSQVLSVTFTPTDLVTYKVASLSVPITVLPATQSPLTTNLLLNPGAELGLVDGAIPNWTAAGEGSPTVDSGTFDRGINPHTGAYDFVGFNGASDTLSQTVSLLTQGVTAALIDGGTVSASLSFWEQGLNQGTPSDDASVTLAFLDVEGTTLSSVNSGEIDSHNGAWQNFTASYPVPAGTRSITYTMNFFRHAGGDLDGFVDDNSLILTTQQAVAATTTTLAITSGTTPVATVASGTVVTLTASVLAGTTPVFPGQVIFCDASASACTDIHLLGTAQLTASGTATLKFIPGIGSHVYKAIFLGTGTYASASSISTPLAVTGKYATSTTITQSGAAGNYTLTAAVTGSGPTAPTGVVSFLDSTNGSAVLATQTLTPGSSSLNFSAPTFSATGTLPLGVAAADLNGDGKLDLIVNNATSNTLSILLGNGDGTFTPATSQPTGRYPSSLAVGDFNNDGKPDVAITDYYDGQLTILLGNGDGTFTPAAQPSTGGDTRTVVTADFNHDGILDLAVGRDNSLVILLGNGDGTFTASSTNPATGNGPNYGLATGDFNGDGRPDIAVTNSADSTLSILLGNGDGTFTAAASPATGSFPVSIAVVDLNRDGKLDLAVANALANTVTILLGNGDGTFTAAATPTTDASPQSVVAGDLNGDGIPDLSVTNETAKTVTILLGNGDGTFTPSTPLSPGVGPDRALIADLNGDGIADLVTNDASAGGISIYLGHLAASSTATATGIAPIGTGTHQIIASYAGDTFNAASASTPVALTAKQVATTTIVASSLNPSPAGNAVTFTATIAPVSASGIPATGSIVFTDGTNLLGTVSLSSTGSATVTTSNLTPTTHAIRAAYSGDTNFAPSSAVLSQVVQPAMGLTFSSRNLSFGNQTVGTTSAPQAVVISNFTGVTINIADFLLILGPNPSDFVETNNCPAAFLANATCTLNISFAPHGVGSKSAGVEIDDDSTPSTQSVNFTGTGTGGILQVTPGNLKTIAGTGTAGYTGDNGLATAAQLNLPAGVVVDPTGIVYIADELNSVVRKVDLSGKITTIAGTGVPAYTGDGGPATAATLKYPATLTLDTAGNLYIFDDGNNAVRKITTSTGIITTFAGTGTAGHAGDGGPATSARLNQPQGGKFDRAGNLYVPDCVGSNLRKIDTKGIITTVAGNFSAGFSGDGGPAINAQLYCPSGVDIDAAGNLYIADDLNNRIRKVDTNGIITTIAGDGNAAFNGDNISAATAELNLPNDVALDAAGNLYIADSGNNRIRKIDTTGTITTVAGGLQNAGSAGVNTPLSLTIAPSGNLYFVDSGNNAVRQLFPAGATPFPATVLGTPATAQTLTISNIGNVAVTIASAQSFTLTGNATDFALTGGTCLTGATLAANGGSCTLQITFTPTATGLRMLTVSIVDTALNSPQSFTISGTGTTAAPTITWTPSPATVTYGTPLGPQQLDAVATTPTGATLAGTYAYTPAAGTVLPIGTQTLSVLFTPASAGYTPASATQTVTITQAIPTLAWATPAPIVQGTALSATQLNATATGITGATLPGTFVYTPAAGTIPAAGIQTLSVTFTPTDTVDYTTATTTVRLTVTGLTLTSFTPNTASLGDPAKTITLTGAGFSAGTIAQVNGTSIATTFVNATTLTAVVPASNFAAVGTLTVTVVNAATSSRSQALPLTVTAPAPSVTLTGPSTTQPSSQPTLALTVTNPYPVPLTATFTLSFASTVTPTVDDPAIQFANGGRTFTFTVAANSTAVPAIQLQAGTVAGTITIPLTLTAAGVNVTPTSLQPVTIVVPAAVPAVTTATITRGTGSFTVTIHGFSNTREVATAAFHFVPATGAQIDTPDVSIPVGPIFAGWFSSTPSVTYGSTFTYTQIFNVSDTAANIGSVQVTLTNSVGVSTTYTAQ